MSTWKKLVSSKRVIQNLSQTNDERGDMAKIKREDNQHKIFLHSASTLTD